jgi:hypothetical protein
VRKAHTPGWVAYEIERACWLIGGSLIDETRKYDLVVTSFQKDAITRLPLGTTEMVFSVDGLRDEPGPPQIRLSADEAPLAPQRRLAEGGSYELIGRQADRILSWFAQGGATQVVLTSKDNSTVSVDLTRKDFAEAYKAFNECVRTSSQGAPVK